jgi:hypothetical protein
MISYLAPRSLIAPVSSMTVLLSGVILSECEGSRFFGPGGLRMTLAVETVASSLSRDFINENLAVQTDVRSESGYRKDHNHKLYARLARATESSWDPVPSKTRGD